MRGKTFVLAAAALACLAMTVSAAESGKAVFDQKCSSCHGKDAKGNAGTAKMFKVDGAALDLTDKDTQAKSDEKLAATVNKGMGKMPSFDGKLSAADVTATIAYVRSLAGTSAGTKSESTAPATSEAAGLFQTKCASCHAKDAKGSAGMAKMFKVDGAALDLTDAGTQAKSESDLASVVKKGSGKMPSFDGKLKDDEIHSLAAYIKSLKGK